MLPSSVTDQSSVVHEVSE